MPLGFQPAKITVAGLFLPEVSSQGLVLSGPRTKRLPFLLRLVKNTSFGVKKDGINAQRIAAAPFQRTRENGAEFGGVINPLA